MNLAAARIGTAGARHGAKPAGAPSLIQRKCTCGGKAGMSGECDECEASKLTGVQAKSLVAGFADANETDPMATSENRAKAVAAWLAGKGVASASLKPIGFGGSWARFPPKPGETRNRRVQIRLRY